MARTKQTARYSAASKLPRKHLFINHRVARKTAVLSGKAPVPVAVPITGQKGIKKVNLFKPGTMALREIRKYQRNVRILNEESMSSYLFFCLVM